MKFSAHILLITLVIAMTHCSATAEPSSSPIDKTEQWRQAAINREWAAITQESQAWGHVKKSEALATEGYHDDADRLKKLAASAAALQTAGDLQVQAAKNFDRATKNWNRAVRTQDNVAENSSGSKARSSATANTENSVNATRIAADHYEQAAAIYREFGLNGAAKAAASNEKAATCREALAAR